jgi:glycerol-3-phosphate acyltransferase PlsX
MIRVAVDALGGDRAPEEIIAGAVAALSDEIRPTLFGPPALDTGGLPLIEASESISMDDSAVESVKAKTDSSLVRAVRLRGVHRPAIAIVIPTKRGPSVLIDAGANADARPEHLVQFAHMGSVFAEEILGIERPEVRLMSIGEEDEKGNQLTIDAHELLRTAELRFEGNMEGRLLLEGGADVVVADGFTGNVALKTLEGTIRTMLDALVSELGSSMRGRLGGLLIRPGARKLRERLDPETYGGGYLLGLNGLVVIAHGSSSRVAVANAIRLGARGVEHRVAERLQERLSSGVLESARSTTPTVER